MLKAKVSWSTEADAYQSGKASVKMALEELKEKAKFVLAFCTVDYDTTTFLQGVKEEVGEVPIMGCTSFNGILTPGGFIHAEKGVGSVMVISSPEVDFGVGAAEIGDDPQGAGRKAAEIAIAQAGKSKDDIVSAFLMIAPPGAEERLLKGIQDIIGRIPMIGGSAADNTIEGYWKEFANQEVYSNGVIVTVLYSKLPLGTAYSGYYHPTDSQGIITKVIDRRTLVEIDHRKALEVYANWREMETSKLMGANLLSESIVSPLAVRDVSGDLYWVRHPLNGNDDLSIAVGNDLAEETAVIMMKADLDEIVEGVNQVVKSALADLDGPAGALILAHCGGRASALGAKRMEEVALNLKANLGETPFIGFCTFGEQGYVKWTGNGAGGLMLSALALGK